MKHFLLAAVVAVLCCVAAHSAVVFTIPLPAWPSASEFYTAGAGNNFWTVGTGGQLFGVNLTAKKVQSTTSIMGNAIVGLFGMPNGGVIVALEGQVYMAFDANGNFLWTSNEFVLTTFSGYSTIIGTMLFVATNTVNGYEFLVVDLTSGQVVGTPISIVAATVYPDVAVLTTGNGGTDAVTAYSLPSMKQLWSLTNVKDFLTMNENYILVSSNSADGVTQVNVYNRGTLALVNTLQNMGGVFADGFTPVINGSRGYFIAGSPPSLIGVGLVSGNVYLQVALVYNIQGAFIGQSAFAYQSGTTLTIINLANGAQTAIQNVPYQAAGPLIYDLGSGVCAVSNLQGYTSWSSKTGVLVARDETQPGVTPGSNYMWNGYAVYTQGDAVVVATPN